MVRVAVLGSDYFQKKRDVTRMRCTRKSLNCTAHAIDDQNNGRWVSANQPMIEHRPHAIQLYLDQWAQLATVLLNWSLRHLACPMDMLLSKRFRSLGRLWRYLKLFVSIVGPSFCG